MLSSLKKAELIRILGFIEAGLTPFGIIAYMALNVTFIRIIALASLLVASSVITLLDLMDHYYFDVCDW